MDEHDHEHGHGKWQMGNMPVPEQFLHGFQLGDAARKPHFESEQTQKLSGLF